MANTRYGKSLLFCLKTFSYKVILHGFVCSLCLFALSLVIDFVVVVDGCVVGGGGGGGGGGQM